MIIVFFDDRVKGQSTPVCLNNSFGDDHRPIQKCIKKDYAKWRPRSYWQRLVQSFWDWKFAVVSDGNTEQDALDAEFIDYTSGAWK